MDDVINVSGHRIGTAEVESALVGHHLCAEAAVVPVDHPIKGQAIYAFVVRALTPLLRLLCALAMRSPLPGASASACCLRCVLGNCLRPPSPLIERVLCAMQFKGSVLNRPPRPCLPWLAACRR